ncbi:hypothetical protein DRJ25_02765 [Candidatus Woesearchaeota archaeon]|nr:MAG: hypothetical protein DRJ25_02765 [Candidatus Woesearchaeota archaeon]
MYNLNSCSGFSCSYSSISKSYSRSAGSGLDNIVYSMSDSIAVAKDSYSDTNFESMMIRAYDSHDEYQDKGAVAKEALNTSAGVDSSYLVGHQNFNPVSFLNPDRPKARFITNVEELLPIITETFEALTGEDFPDNLSIKICDENELKEIHEAHGGVWVPGIQGFSLNRNGKGVNEVFVRKDALDSMMLTIGHEIGHVMTPTLKDPVDEESKAFAFSLAWIKTIKDNNIADLAGNISPNPARNGLHDKAFSFVIKILNQGKSAFQTFKEIAKGEFKSTQIVEVY